MSRYGEMETNIMKICANRRALLAVACAEAAGFALSAGAWAEEPQKAASPSEAVVQAPAAVPASAGDVDPRISVSTREPRAGGADARVEVGGVKISRARFAVPPAQASDAGASGANANGTIEVPLNTIRPGEGESLQQRSERISAENRRLEAEAAIAEREAARPSPRNDDDRDTVIFFGGHGRRVIRGGHGHGHGFGRDVPVRTDTRWGVGTVQKDDSLHSEAQRHFAEAAAAGTGTLGTLHDEAIRNFGRVSTPSLSEQQRARDEAQRNIQKRPKLPGAAE